MTDDKIAELPELDAYQLSFRIGQGRTSEVFRLQDGRIVKLFSSRVSFKRAQNELRYARTAENAGISVWKLESLVRYQGRIGLLGETLPEGVMSLDLRMIRHPWEVPFWFREIVSLHRQINASSGKGLPSVKLQLRRRIRSSKAPEEAVKVALRRLESLPDGDRICHGDLHPANLLVADGHLLVIDWAGAGKGHPSFDIARTAFLLGNGSSRGRWRWLVHTLGRHCASRYIRKRLEGKDLTYEDLDAWRLPILAARLVRRVDAERDYFTKMIQEELARSA